MSELIELQEKAAKVLAQCKGWSHTKDGSYESCLSYCGYYVILAEILKFEKTEENNEIL